MSNPPIWPDDDERRRATPPGAGSWGPPPPPQRPARDYPPPAEPFYPPAGPRYPEPNYPTEPQRHPTGQPAYGGYPGQGYAPQQYPPQGYAPRQPMYAQPAPQPERGHEHLQRHRFGWSLPVEHLVLAAGIVAMFLALTQPWGVDATGRPILLSDLSYQVAYYTIGALTVLSGLLVLLNRRMGCLAFAGCLALFVIPLLVAASIGGFEILTSLRVIPQLTPDAVKATNRGFFLWWGGLAVMVVGLLFEIITHRRKGIIGI
ncbi:MAG: hypothetical protein IVW57_19620 [Ktedonobacterales bacterium]|nr:hypothetical protein [Ktedonobacterales bacterium]